MDTPRHGGEGERGGCARYLPGKVLAGVGFLRPGFFYCAPGARKIAKKNSPSPGCKKLRSHPWRRIHPMTRAAIFCTTSRLEQQEVGLPCATRGRRSRCAWPQPISLPLPPSSMPGPVLRYACLHPCAGRASARSGRGFPVTHGSDKYVDSLASFRTVFKAEVGE